MEKKMSKKSRQSGKASLGSAKAAKAANDYISCYGPLEETTKKRERAAEKTSVLERRQARTEQRRLVCDGKNMRFDEAQASANAKINSLGKKQTRVNAKIAEAQASGDTAKVQALSTRLSTLTQKIEKKNTSIAGIESKKQAVSQRSASLSGLISELSVLKEQSGTKAAGLFNKENNLAKKILRAEDQFDRQSTNAELATLQVDRLDCKCPAIYDPVVIDGVTYGNSCIAACKGKTIPPYPTPPVSKPPIGSAPRQCLQVVVCGSDGVTYPNSCLPFGVHAVAFGAPCSETNFTPGDPSPSRGRPPAQFAQGRVLSIVGSGSVVPQKICGSNNQTYNSINDLPNGVSIKHFGSCNPAII